MIVKEVLRLRCQCKLSTERFRMRCRLSSQLSSCLSLVSFLINLISMGHQWLTQMLAFLLFAWMVKYYHYKLSYIPIYHQRREPTLTTGLREVTGTSIVLRLPQWYVDYYTLDVALELPRSWLNAAKRSKEEEIHDRSQKRNRRR